MRRLQISIFSLVFIQFCYCHNSTIKARLNKGFFDFFSKAGHKVVDEEIPKIVFPTIHAPIEASVIQGNISLQNLNIAKFKTPKIAFNLTDFGISWKSHAGSFDIEGDWEAHYYLTFLPFWQKQHGWVNAIASGIRVNLSATAFVVDHKPQVKIGDCTADVDNLKIRIGGGFLPFIEDLFIPLINSIIKKAIHEQACETAKNVLIIEFNDFLHSLPSRVPIGNDFFILYSFASNPKSTSSYFEGEGIVNVVYGNMTCIPERQKDWNDAGPNPRMVTAWLSESIANCLLMSAHKGNLTHFLIDKNTQEVARYLRTSCGIIDICMGKFFSQLKKMYPNQYVDLNFRTYSPPFMMLENGTVTANFTFAVDFHVNPMAKYKKPLARLIVETSSTIHPYLNGTRIYGELGNMTSSLSEDFSTIGHMSSLFLKAFQEVFSLSARLAINAVIKKGLPIPIYDNVTIAGKIC
ncbi:hypothetical protein WR25_05870 isoform B [Diploscapter pachys]|uniref:Lipid-binding serum glycoprotein C-terminal domain-containing protein n=1 Tax=Diploscapter pachys TaxID=2018661 RepID=A0A2A2L914_9BILA|nr:hypothetical protein WR25_05870 isoform B [Diploscapter pachys]